MKTLARPLWLLLLSSVVAAVMGAPKYRVEVLSAPGLPVISWLDGQSDFAQAFNAAWIESPAGRGLLVRAQNCSASPGGPCVHCSGAGAAASVLAYARLGAAGDEPSVVMPSFTALTAKDIVFSPSEQRELYGTEDPRVVYDARTGLHYLFYTCCVLGSHTPPPFDGRSPPLAHTSTTAHRHCTLSPQMGLIVCYCV